MDTAQKKSAAKWLRRIKADPQVLRRVKLVREKELMISKLRSDIARLSQEIDDHEPLRNRLPMAPIDRYVAMPKDMEVNGFNWWEYAHVELGDTTENGFERALSIFFALAEDGILSERDRHR